MMPDQTLIETKPSPLLSTHYRGIETRFDVEHGALWSVLNQKGVPAFTLEFLGEAQHHQQMIKESGGVVEIDGSPEKINYLVNSTRSDQIFSLGGDLSLFCQLIKNADKNGLTHYGMECIKILHSRLNHSYIDATTIALVRGEALGGGFETALANDIIIAEKHSRMGFPEILFNLFPGMGAYTILARKVGERKAQEMILSGVMYTANELFEMGIVDIVVDSGCGEAAVNRYMKRQKRHANGIAALHEVRRRFSPISLDELYEVIHIWVKTALLMNESDLKTMERLVRMQQKTFLGD